MDNDKRLGVLRALDRVSEHQGGVYAQQGPHTSSIDRETVAAHPTAPVDPSSVPMIVVEPSFTPEPPTAQIVPSNTPIVVSEPTFTPEPPTPTATPRPAPTVEPPTTTMMRTTDPKGVAPLDNDNCPLDYPIKGNRDSMLYHEQDDRSYKRTHPEICFATRADAEAAGFHRPESP